MNNQAHDNTVSRELSPFSRRRNVEDLSPSWIPGRAGYRQLARNDGQIEKQMPVAIYRFSISTGSAGSAKAKPKTLE